MDFDGRGLELDGFGLGEGLVFGCVLGPFTLFGVVDVVVVDVGGEIGGHGGFLEAWGVGRGLDAKLGEVEVGAGFVADVHGLVEAALGVEAVEDYGVDGDGDDFDGDFDEGADERPALLIVSISRYDLVSGTCLQPTNKGIIHILIKEGFPFAAFARPSPHIIALSVPLTFIQHSCADDPHDGIEGEESNGEKGVVYCCFLRPSVSTSPVGVEDAKGAKE